MKKLIALVLFLIALASTAVTEDIDFDNYTLEELRDMQQRISATISRKQNEVACPAEPIEGATLRDLFEDVELAKLVRDTIGAFSVDDVVAQDQLDAVTELRVPGRTMLSSLAGISHLRKLISLKFSTDISTAYGRERRVSDPEYASLLCSELPDEIGQLTNLRYLSFCQTRFERFPDSMRNLVNLESLFVRGAALKELPDWIGEWTQLKSLEVWQCFIDAVPDSIGALVNLTELQLTDTDITVLPDGICDLPNLRSLKLDYTQLQALPDRIGSLSTLQALDISYTPIKSLPASIRDLNLAELSMAGTAIE